MKTTRFFSLFLLVFLLLGLVASPTAAALEVPEVQAKAALLVDANTGTPVYAKNEHQELYPASLTKIMTALLVMEALEEGTITLDQSITVTPTALSSGLSEDGSSAGIKAGEILTVEQLLHCMLLVSANEACNILAETVSGSVEAFVAEMNAKAAALGCENTHFINTTGLHDSQHYTSAWDLYLITKEALTHPDFLRICDTPAVTIPATNLSPARNLYTTNYLISVWRSRGYINKDAHGIKTGFTDQAGHCLVSSAQKGSLSFLSVMLGADRVTLEDGEIRTYSFYDTNRLFDWAFDNLAYQTVLSPKEIIQEVAVSLSRKTNYVTVRPAQELELLLPRDTVPEDLVRTVSIKTPVEAPITEGQVLGELTLSLDGKDIAVVDLLALNDVEASKLLTLWRDVKLFFARPTVRMVCIALGALVVLVVLWKLLFGRRRYRSGYSASRRGRSGYRGRRRH